MYQPAHHNESRLEVQHALIEAHRLGLLVTMGRSGILANPVPFTLDRAAEPKGVLRAHIARANPLWTNYDPAVEALTIFQGPQAYISPSWYPTKQETGEVVPTWNYVIVHAYGKIAVIEDRDWLYRQIVDLTQRMEDGRKAPWSVTDAPAAFVEAQIRNVVGIEIPIARIEGKWKLSQNRRPADRSGVIDGLSASGDETHRAMAALMSAAESEK